MLHAVQRPGPLPPSRSPPFRRCALLTVIPTPVSCLHFAQPRKSSTPSLSPSLLHTFHTLLRTPSWGFCAVGGTSLPYNPSEQPLLRSASPTGRLLSSLLFFAFFPVSPLRRTPAQLPCYESKGRLGIPSVQIRTVLGTVGHPSRPPQKILIPNFRAIPAARRWKRSRSVSDRSLQIPRSKLETFEIYLAQRDFALASAFFSCFLPVFFFCLGLRCG